MKLPIYKNKDVCIEYCRFSPSIENNYLHLKRYNVHDVVTRLVRPNALHPVNINISFDRIYNNGTHKRTHKH